MSAIHQVKDKFLLSNVERLGPRGDQYQNLEEPLKHTRARPMPCSLRSHLPLPSLSLPHPGQPEPEVAQLLSHVQLFATPWTIAYQASPSMGLSRQEYQSGFPFPGIEPRSSELQADALPSEPPGKPL